MQPDERSQEPWAVLNGIDVLVAEEFARLRNRRVGIIANHSSVDLYGRRSIDLLYACEDLTLIKIFSPEHGLHGTADTRIGDSRDDTTGLAVFSLYGETLKPTEAQLGDLDALVYDLQDIGCRFYTYITTMGWAMEACAQHRVPFVVLDRPNPIAGLDVEGPCSDEEHESLVAYHELPLRHGMTAAELARLFNEERALGTRLEVVEMRGWQRALWFHDTGQPWINPSPNIRDETAALLFPGVGLIEGTNVSVGRGTAQPFHVMGAPWIQGTALSSALNELELDALRTEPVEFTPLDRGHQFYGQRCSGVRFIVGDEQAFSPAMLGLALIQTLRRLYPDTWEYRKLDALLGRTDLLQAIEDHAPELADLWAPDPDFFDARARALIYGEAPPEHVAPLG